MKTLFLSIIFLALPGGLFAQEKTNICILRYVPDTRFMSISINGEEYKEPKIPKEAIKGYDDVNPAIREIHKLEREGWKQEQVLISSTTVSPLIYVFILKKDDEK